DSYTLSLAGPPPAWEVSWGQNPVLLEPGAVKNVDLLVVPPNAPTTSPGALALTVTAQNGFASASDGASLEILPFHQLDLSGTGTSVAAGPPVAATKVWKKARAQTQARLDVIVRTRGRATPANESALAGHGASVKRRFTLVDGIAARIPAAQLSAIAAEPFVASVELDEAVAAVAATPENVAMVNVGGLRSRGVDGSGVGGAI